MKWATSQGNSERSAALAEGLGLSPFLASLMVDRGYENSQDATAFLNPKLADFINPLSLPGIEVAARRLVQAIDNHEKVVVYGDYDVDGITATSLLLAFFRDLGFSADFMLPSRFVDGYGLNPARVKEICESGYQLLITVDCGSASREEIKYLTQAGVDVVVTDHHRVQEDIPEAVAHLNPDCWSEHREFTVLAGVGVAYLLVMAVSILLKEEEKFASRVPPLKKYLDIVTVGTIADMVPLIGPNRVLVVHGMRQLATTRSRPGIIALREVSGLAGKPVDSTAIAFYMAPRINAAGRLGNADVGVELLLSPSLSKALVFAGRLDDDNNRRRELEGEIFSEADRVVRAAIDKRDLRAIVLASPQWHKGVLGIVASRLCEKYNRPTFLMVIEDGIATGSGRSVAGFDLATALEKCRDVLLRYGGHAMAAGLSMQVEKLDSFRERFEQLVTDALGGRQPVLELAVDKIVPLVEVNQDMIRDLGCLAPFGMGNPEPVIGVRDVRIKSRQIVGGDHLKLMIEDDGRVLEAIGFRMGDLAVRVDDRVDIAFFPEIRAWGGTRYLQLRLKDIRPAGQED